MTTSLRRAAGPVIAAAVCLGLYSGKRNVNQEQKTLAATVADLRISGVEEAGASLGIQCRNVIPKTHWKFDHVGPYLQSTHLSVAVADFDKDGYQDLHLNKSDASAGCLLRNREGKGFEDVTERIAYKATEPSFPVARSFFYDWNEDGYLDLTLVEPCPRVFISREGKSFTEDKALSSQFRCSSVTMGFNFYDINKDGFLDVIMAPHLAKHDIYNDPKTTKVMPSNFLQSINGSKPQVYLRGAKPGEYLWDEKSGLDHEAWAHAVGVFHSARLRQDLVWFANDFGLDRGYVFEENGKFQRIPDFKMIQSYSRNGMNAEIADVDNDGSPLIYVSHIVHGQVKLGGNNLWKWSGGSDLAEIGESRGIKSCGWAWGGKFFDVDNDGDLDLMVGNGMVSQDPKMSYWFQILSLSAADGDLLTDSRNWPPIKNRSISGHERSCLFINENGSFTDVADSFGVLRDFRGDERALASLDFDNDGSVEILAGVKYQEPRLYRFTNKGRPSWIGFEVLNDKGLPVFGASVKIHFKDGSSRLRQIQPFNGYSAQSDPRLHFGLGSLLEGDIESIELQGPDHRRVQVPDWKIGTYNRITWSRK